MKLLFTESIGARNVLKKAALAGLYVVQITKEDATEIEHWHRNPEYGNKDLWSTQSVYRLPGTLTELVEITLTGAALNLGLHMAS